VGCAHPFWSSHEEKTALVRALHGRWPWGLVGEEGRGRGEAAGGARVGMGRGCYWRRGLSPCCSMRLFSVRSLCLREAESRKSKIEKRKEEGKEKKKRKKWENFPNLEISGKKKIKYNL
jgi:hypothetical protein